MGCPLTGVPSGGGALWGVPSGGCPLVGCPLGVPLLSPSRSLSACVRVSPLPRGWEICGPSLAQTGLGPSAPAETAAAPSGHKAAPVFNPSPSADRRPTGTSAWIPCIHHLTVVSPGLSPRGVGGEVGPEWRGFPSGDVCPDCNRWGGWRWASPWPSSGPARFTGGHLAPEGVPCEPVRVPLVSRLGGG